MPLWQHLDDTAAVAGRLWDVWVPRSVRREIAVAVDGDDARARRLLTWLAGIHDVGKASPAFAVQYPDGAHRMAAHGLTTSLSPKDPERRMLRHELAGHICLNRWLKSRYGWRVADADRLAVVVGGHHGIAPTSAQVQAGSKRPELLGDGLWTQVQDAYLDRQAARYLHDDDLRSPIRPSKPAQVLLTALVIVADWIASNEDFFGYRTGEPVQTRLDRAWRRIDLPAPWDVDPHTTDPDVLLAERFGRTDGARPVQAVAVELAAGTTEPGLMVVEAPMGEGKTEAALMAAEVLAARTGAGGCFVALPTQATTDAMFGRVRAWLDALPTEGAQSVFLAHSKASLNDEYRGLLPDGHPTSIAIDSDDESDNRRTQATGWAPAQAVSAVVHQWLRGRKKGVLASFVVGTVDQTLFTALKSRHLVLRHLALAGKVVVIDEVHAYDVYMGSYLDRALHWLGAYGVPVVLLSATLPRARREEMVAAYRSGRRREGAVPEPDDGAYPVLTATDGDSVVRRPTLSAGRRTEVDLELLAGGGDELQRLGDRLAAELDGGGCALVVRNTVTRVQETGRYLVERFGAEHVTVTHARFLAVDRAANDVELLRRFGPPGPGMQRPHWHVVVGSQVVEQSLDVDFDLLVTDLAPVDLVLQRMGRLHRHARGEGQSDRAARLRRARCLLTGVDQAVTPPALNRGSTAVYEPAALLRSAAVLLPHLQTDRPVVLPDDIATLVQQAYGAEQVGPVGWQEEMARAQARAAERASRRRQTAETFQLGEAEGSGAILGWVQAGVGEAEDGPQGEAQVRDGEMTLEVLVAVRTTDGLVVPPWVRPHGGELLSTNLIIEPGQARVLASCALRLPVSLTRDPHLLDAVIAELERDFVGAWQKSPLLAGELVLVLDPDGRRELAGHQLQYTRSFGLEVVRA
ncbi:MAG: CRISPR-associated helicase Cas3' [Actinomycetota bacterium]|nr:CRISPR-associated helicase Cas3' [Actinomycetota bacterium]